MWGRGGRPGAVPDANGGEPEPELGRSQRQPRQQGSSSAADTDGNNNGGSSSKRGGTADNGGKITVAAKEPGWQEKESLAWAGAMKRVEDARVHWTSVLEVGLSQAIERQARRDRRDQAHTLRPIQRLLLVTLCARGWECAPALPLVEVPLALDFDVMLLTAHFLARSSQWPCDENGDRLDLDPSTGEIEEPFLWHLDADDPSKLNRTLSSMIC